MSRVAKRFFAGTHRAAEPEHTLARLSPRLAELGITRVANVTGLDSIGLPVVMVCRPNSRSLAVSQGKGSTLAAAKVSGIMESIEAYHAEHMAHATAGGRLEEVARGRTLADVRALPQAIERPFSEDLAIPWVEGRDLVRDASIWVPYETVHTDFREPAAPGHGHFCASSNGLASGNHLLEAISHGLSEVVERDAMTLWMLRSSASRARRRLDPATVSDPGCAALLDRLDRAGVAAALWDITTDLGIAAFECAIVERETDPLRLLHPATGNGCHPAREIALSRAISEAVQSRLTAISGARDDLSRDRYVAFRDPTFLDAKRREVMDGPCPRRFSEVQTFESDTLDADVAFQIERLAASGIDRAIAVDLTKPEIGVPVVRVVVPGLECAAIFPGTYSFGPRAKALAIAEAGS